MRNTPKNTWLISSLTAFFIFSMATMGTNADFSSSDTSGILDGISEIVIAASDEIDPESEKDRMLMEMSGSGSACCACYSGCIFGLDQPKVVYLREKSSRTTPLIKSLVFQPPNPPPRPTLYS